MLIGEALLKYFNATVSVNNTAVNNGRKIILKYHRKVTGGNRQTGR